MKSWNLKALDLKPRLPEILSSSQEGRAIVLDLRAGEDLSEHEVHERAWIVVVDGDVEVTSADGARVAGGSGLLVEFAPAERHEVVARSAARILLLLAPWPGKGHPGVMTIRDKLYARRACREAGRRLTRTIATPKEAEYFRHGGILPCVLRQPRDAGG